MKIICLCAIAVCLIMVSCNSFDNSDNVKSFIPGTYISFWKTEYSKSIDTLLIEHLMEQGSESYAITSRTHVTFIKNPGQRAPEYRIKHWIGIYDVTNKTVVLSNDGSVLSFDPVKKEMKRGSTSYRKL